MTSSNYLIISVILLFVIHISTNLYQKIVLKKEVKWKYNSIIIVLLWITFIWRAEYRSFLVDNSREIYEIPKLENTMYLNYRSRFKEQWINKDTSSMKHASKVIKLGMSIEKEVDFYTNSKEVKTLVIENRYPIFGKEVKKEYYLMNVVVNDNNYAKRLIDRTILTTEQKDSILIKWQL